jgi:hypothetical protein
MEGAVANPVAASAAATAITNRGNISPPVCSLLKKFENVTKFVLTALNIDSRLISALTVFLLVINPKNPTHDG